MKKIVKPLLMTMSLLLASADLWAASITGVRSWRAPDNTRLVLDLTEKTSYRQVDAQSKQLIIELDNTDLAISSLNLPSRIGLVQNVLLERVGDKQRLIINLSDEVRPHIFMLPANEKFSPRLVVDLYDKMLMQATTPVIETEDSVSQSGANKGRSVIVVVDAGHGGEDSGAIGATGNYEKHVTLAIAKKLVALLRQQKGFKAYLTRDDDYFIPLQERRKIARNRYKADIFISIHADAALSPRAKGASVFALSRKGANSATSRFAQALAERENKSDLIGGVDHSFGKDSQLSNILADMVVEGSVTHSLHMGGSILQQMGDLTKLHSKRVEQAGFAVLKEAGMISLLVETGFMTNAEEEAKLITPHYQQQMARAVFNGVHQFVQKYPMPQSYFAWGKEQNNRQQRNRALKEVGTPPPKVVPNAEKLLDKPAIDNSAVLADFAQLEVKKLETTETLKTVKETVKTPSKTTTIQATLPASLEDFMAETPTAKLAKNSANNPPTVKTEPKSKSTIKTTLKPTTHQVIQGDSLSAIAARYQLSAEDIKQWNQLKSDNVMLGQKLRLMPPETQKQPPQNAIEPVKKTSSKVDTSEVVTKKPAPELKPKTHKVQVGDSLSSIAVKYGVSAAAIKDLNKLKDDNVVLDTRLKIPQP